MRIFCFLFFVILSFPAFSGCNHFYYEEKKPLTSDMSNTELCFDKFTVMYSNEKKIALWSAEKLTKDDIVSAIGISRTDTFHTEKALDKSSRAVLSDYVKSGYDRGHLTPDRDFPESKDLDSLANIVPQDKIFNRGVWSGLEASIRKMAIDHDVYVITGTILKSDKKIRNGIPVPSHLYKIVIANNKIDVFVAENKEDSVIENWSLLDIEINTDILFLF